MIARGATRRDVLATIAGGAILGAVWGAAFPALAMEGRPTIAVIGEQNAQLALIDAGSARALVFIGEPDDALLERLPAMLTVFRQRIDLVIGSAPTLAAHAGALSVRWNVRHAVTVSPAHESPSLPIPSTTVSDALDIALGEHVTLEIRVGHRDEWRTPDPGSGQPLWSLHVRRDTAAVTIVPDARSFAATLPGPSAVLIAPSAPSPELRAKSPARSLAINFDSESIDPAAGRRRGVDAHFSTRHRPLRPHYGRRRAAGVDGPSRRGLDGSGIARPVLLGSHPVPQHLALPARSGSWLLRRLRRRSRSR